MTTLHGSSPAPRRLLEGRRRRHHRRLHSPSVLGRRRRSADRGAIASGSGMSSSGWRAMACGCWRSRRSRPRPSADAESDMTLLGLVAMIDPPRPEARLAVETCKQAGIRAVMITGDHPLTARTVAHELAMLTSHRVVTGQELDTMSDEALRARSTTSPSTRASRRRTSCASSTAWQTRGNIVAMTGDGVNDAPALKKADIGIAMGITGTDVSKEAAGMTLLDDNFATIVAAVEEGPRRLRQHQEVSDVSAVVQRRRDRAAGRGSHRRAADAAHRGADSLRQPRHRRPAGARIGRRSA